MSDREIWEVVSQPVEIYCRAFWYTHTHFTTSFASISGCWFGTMTFSPKISPIDKTKISYVCSSYMMRSKVCRKFYFFGIGYFLSCCLPPKIPRNYQLLVSLYWFITSSCDLWLVYHYILCRKFIFLCLLTTELLQ